MTVQIDTQQARYVAARIRVAVGCVEAVNAQLGLIDWQADASELTSPIRLRANELIEEAGAVAGILDSLADQLEAIDSDALPRTLGQINRAVNVQLDALDASLADDIGSTRGPELRRFLEFHAFDGREPPRAPIVLLDQRAWLAEHVTGAVLARLDGHLAAQYWDVLDDDSRFATIQVQPASVSGHVIAGHLELSRVERMTLLVQPVPVGTAPISGAGTDWLGQPIPAMAGQDGSMIVRLDPTTDDGGGIAIVPENWACVAVQSWSLIPSRPDESVGGVAASARGAAEIGFTTVKAGASSVKLLTPTAWAATFADLALCRFEMGSADPISTKRVWDDDRQVMVYEDSRNEHHANLTQHGLPVPPRDADRDEQRWIEEHRTEPYPGYPAYPEYAPEAD